jgi:uncharacterized protein (TIGR02757 family)
MDKKLKDFLDRKVEEYNRPSFIEHDPISIPHLFSKKQDIEIAAFFASIFAWGNRTTIINKSKTLLKLMDDAPYDFIATHKASDLKKLIQFKHRTFNATDVLYFILFLRHHYQQSKTLESAFTKWMEPNNETIERALAGFHDYFFSLQDAPVRTKKHIATPKRNSTCKRLNMFLRWMVRKDNCGVDFGIWNKISPSQLVCPIDVHVARVAKRFHLIERKQIDWQTALQLTSYLKKFDPDDPAKYDFALFGLGVVEKF